VKCRRLLFKAEEWFGRIEIKCPKCGFIDMISMVVDNGDNAVKYLITREQIELAQFDIIGAYREKANRRLNK